MYRTSGVIKTRVESDKVNLLFYPAVRTGPSPSRHCVDRHQITANGQCSALMIAQPAKRVALIVICRETKTEEIPRETFPYLQYYVFTSLLDGVHKTAMVPLHPRLLSKMLTASMMASEDGLFGAHAAHSDNL